MQWLRLPINQIEWKLEVGCVPLVDVSLALPPYFMDAWPCPPVPSSHALMRCHSHSFPPTISVKGPDMGIFFYVNFLPPSTQNCPQHIQPIPSRYVSIFSGIQDSSPISFEIYPRVSCQTLRPSVPILPSWRYPSSSTATVPHQTTSHLTNALVHDT